MSATPFGLNRPNTWKVAFWTSAAIGYLWGTVSEIYFSRVKLPAFQALEEKKREKVVADQLAEKDRQKAELQARLDKYEPPAPKENVAATGAKFHFRDLENDELLDKFVSFVNEGLEPIAEDAVAGDAFTDKT